MKIVPNTDCDNCAPTIVRLLGGGWTLQNIFDYHPYKPGVLEIYEL